MKNKLPKIIKTLLIAAAVLLSALSMCLTMLIGTLGNTLMNADYLKDELSGKGVYKGLTDEIKDEAKKQYYKSDYRSEKTDALISDLLDAVLLPDLLQKETEQMIDELYNGKKLSLNAEYFAEDYTESIYTFVQKRDPSISRDKIEELLNTVTTAVSENVDLTEYTEQVSESVMKLFAWVIAALLAGILLTVLLFAIILLLSEERLRNLAIPFFISGGIMLVVSLIGMAALGNGVRVLNDSMSDFVNSVLQKLIALCAGYGVKNLVVGGLLLLARKILSRRAKAT